MSINFVPHFNNEVSCVFASDDNFAPYLGTVIKSLIENSTKENNYGMKKWFMKWLIIRLNNQNQTTSSTTIQMDWTKSFLSKTNTLMVKKKNLSLSLDLLL